MCDQSRSGALAWAHGPRRASRRLATVGRGPNSPAFPLAQRRAGAPVFDRDQGDSSGPRGGDSSRIVAGLMLSGFLTEACLMARIEGGPYEVGGLVAGFALLFLAWFWLSLACLLQPALRLVAN